MWEVVHSYYLSSWTKLPWFKLIRKLNSEENMFCIRLVTSPKNKGRIK